MSLLSADLYVKWLEKCPYIGNKICSILFFASLAAAQFLAKCPNITHVRLISDGFGQMKVDANISEQIFASMPQSIKKLTVSSLKLDKFPDLANLKGLQILVCKSLVVTQPMPSWISEMPNLKKFKWMPSESSLQQSTTMLPPKMQKFKGQNLKGINCDIFCNCKIRELELERVPFVLDENYIDCFNKLNQLSITESPYNSAWNTNLWHKMKLTRIELCNCSITEFPTDLLKLSSLSLLNLSNNKITSIPSELISGECCPELQTLNLSKNDIELPLDFSNHPSLRECSLDDNPRLRSHWVACKQYGNHTMEWIVLTLLQLIQDDFSIGNKSYKETFGGSVINLLPIRDEYHFAMYCQFNANNGYETHIHKLATTRQFKLLSIEMVKLTFNANYFGFDIYKK